MRECKSRFIDVSEAFRKGYVGSLDTIKCTSEDSFHTFWHRIGSTFALCSGISHQHLAIFIEKNTIDC